MAEDEKPPDGILWHQSGVAPTGEPFVQLLRGEEIIAQMGVEQARDHARAITEAAEAAEQDAFLLAWVVEHVGAGKAQAAGLLMDWRRFRAERTGKSQGPTNPRDWVMPKPGKMPKYPDFGGPDDPLDFTKKDPRK